METLAIGVRPSAGFTLLETLVAMSILALVLTAIFEVLDRGLAGGRIGAQYVYATALARAKLAEYSLPDRLAEGEYAGTEPDPARADAALHWRIRVAPYAGDGLGPIEGAPAIPWSLGVEVDWREGGRTRSLALDTIALGAP